MPADDKELWAALLQVVRTLLATGKTSTRACELLLVALRGCAHEWLAGPTSAAAATRAPLTLCTQAGRPLLGDLEEALLDVHLTQVGLNSVCDKSLRPPQMMHWVVHTAEQRKRQAVQHALNPEGIVDFYSPMEKGGQCGQHVIPFDSFAQGLFEPATAAEILGTCILPPLTPLCLLRLASLLILQVVMQHHCVDTAFEVGILQLGSSSPRSLP